MTARLIGVCEACQHNKHTACPGAPCVCDMRGHPDRTPIQTMAQRYQPDPSAA